MHNKEEARELQNAKEREIVLLAVAAAMFAWVMRAVLDFYFYYSDTSFTDLLLLHIPARELYSRVSIASAFLMSGIVISETIKKMRITEERSYRLARCVRSVRAVNQLITRETDADRLCERACCELAEGMGYRRVEILVDDEAKGLCEQEVVRRSRFRPKAPEAKPVSIPIACGDVEFGKLQVTLGSKMVWDDEERALLREVSEDIGFALRSIGVDRDLRQQREELQTILDSVSAYISYKDREGRYLRVNSALARVSGIPKEEWTGRTLSEVMPGCGTAPCISDAEVVETGKPKHSFLEAMELPSGTRWLSTDRVPFKDSSGDVAGVISLSVDITERMQAERELSQKDEQLRQAQKMEAVGQLAGGVAHDFNNLLTAISGYTELALSRVESEDPMEELLEPVSKAAERAADLTRQLLAFSRKQPLSLEEQDLNTIIREMSGMLERLIGEDVELVVDLGEEAEAIEADRTQMEQVVMNLAVNARDAMPEGGRLTISTHGSYIGEEDCADAPGVRPGPHVCLSVTDTGYGMDETTLRQIFEPFFTTKRPSGGTGLGLSVVYGIIEQHGGWVQVVSEPKRGTTFLVFLPAVSDDRKSEEELPDAPQKVVADSPKGTGQRVLLVEDEEAVRLFASRALSDWGYEVVEAESAEQALDLFSTNPDAFDLVFSDVVLPGRSGTQLAEEVATRKPDLHVLLASGYFFENRGADFVSSIEKIGFPFLDKPYSVRSLREAVHNALACQ